MPQATPERRIRDAVPWMSAAFAFAVSLRQISDPGLGLLDCGLRDCVPDMIRRVYGLMRAAGSRAAPELRSTCSAMWTACRT